MYMYTYRPALEALEQRVALATNLVANINPVAGVGSAPSWFTGVGAKMFFSADDGTIGQELHVRDGGNITGIDLNPAGSSLPNKFVSGNGVCYFVATDVAHGTELWKSDGGPLGAGTEVIDVWPGPTTSNPLDLTMMNGTLYFAASNMMTGREIWSYDGTNLVCLDTKPGPPGIDPHQFAVMNNLLYFAGRITNGVELCVSDGVFGGNTAVVKDINPGAGDSFPREIRPIGNEIVFTAIDGTHGREVWKSNGLEQGTALLWDIEPGALSSEPTELTVVGNAVFFVADSRTNPVVGNIGTELFACDFDPVSGGDFWWDITPGAPDSDPANLTKCGSKLFFVAQDGNTGRELHVVQKTAGVYSQGDLIKDIFEGPVGSDPKWLTDVNGVLFFSANDFVQGFVPHGVELWKSTGASAQLVKDIYPGVNGSEANELRAVGNSLFLSADDGVNGHELWDPKVKRRHRSPALSVPTKVAPWATIISALDVLQWNSPRKRFHGATS